MQRETVMRVAGRTAYVVLGAVLMLGAMTFVHAATFRGDQASCDHLSMFAAHTAEVRDSGGNRQEFLDFVEQSLAAARNNPESYIKDQDDVNFVMNVVKRVFDNPSMTEEQAYTSTSEECLRKPVKHSLI